MTPKTLVAAIVFVAVFAIDRSPAHAGDAPEDPAIVDQLVVLPAPSHTLVEIVAAIEAAGLVDVAPVDSIPGRNIWLLTHVPQVGVGLPELEAIVLALKEQGFVEWAEVNYEAQTAEGRTDSLWVTSLGSWEEFAGQYASQLLGLTEAHERSTGAGVAIAVLDTGADLAHPALQGSFVAGWSFIDSSPSTLDQGNGADDDGDGLVDECVGHGTFVTSLIRLVAPGAAIMPLKVLDSDGRADNFTVAKAMFYAVDQGVDVMNMSLGTTYHSQAMEMAADEAFLSGIIVVGAMGNQGVTEPREYPACDGSAYGIAATDAVDIVAPFSNYGPRTDFCAPGTTTLLGDVPVPGQSIVGAVPGGGYATWSGTSFATAFASGVAALVRAQHPDWPSESVPAHGVADAVMSKLVESAVDILPWNPEYLDALGAGRLDAAAAVLLGPAVTIPADLNGDGVVDGLDLSVLLGAWGACSGCSADIDSSGVVDGVDLSALLGSWS